MRFRKIAAALLTLALGVLPVSAGGICGHRG